MPKTTSATFKMFARGTRGRAAVAMIGDDDYQDRGTAGWPISRHAIRWARWVLLHAAAAVVEHYEAAIEAAWLFRTALIVECSTTTLPRWRDAVAASPNRPSGAILVPSEGVHPILSADWAVS